MKIDDFGSELEPLGNGLVLVLDSAKPELLFSEPGSGLPLLWTWITNHLIIVFATELYKFDCCKRVQLNCMIKGH